MAVSDMNNRGRAYVVMGVAGCGKSTVGRLLAKELGIPFHDGDDYHPEANRLKMHAGIPLTDEDRWPWYDILRKLIEDALSKGESLVLACSALKQVYRDRLDPTRDGRTLFIWLDGSFELIEARMKSRQGHFMPVSLLKSQFETLEKPGHCLRVDVAVDPDTMVKSILSTLRQASRVE